jgi:acyl carrier protein
MTRDEVRSRLKSIVARTFSVSEGDLSDDTGADDVDGWDSLAHATLLIRIAKAFDMNLNANVANSAQNLGELVQIVWESQR